MDTKTITKSRILRPGQLKELHRELREERSRTSMPALESPETFPAPPGRLPLSRPGTTDQRNQPTSAQYSGLIRRRPRIRPAGP